MFGLFKSEPFQDGFLGLLTRSGSYWKGTIALGPHRNVALRLTGTSKAPDPAGLALAHELPARFNDLLPLIQASLFEHYQPYLEAASAGELPKRSAPFPKVSGLRMSGRMSRPFMFSLSHWPAPRRKVPQSKSPTPQLGTKNTLSGPAFNNGSFSNSAAVSRRFLASRVNKNQ